jgi:hypothetical protein
MASYTGEIFWECSLLYGTVRHRVALLRDNGPIGSNTVIDTQESFPYTGTVWFVWPDEYDGLSPVAWRVRFVLYGTGGSVVPYPDPWTRYIQLRYERWLVLISPVSWSDPYSVPADPLPDYDSSDGTSNPNHLFSVPSGCVWTAGGARMMRCDGTQIIATRYPDIREIFGGNTDKQQPCPVATDYDSPIFEDTMWELEYAEYRVPRYVGILEWTDGRFHTYREERYIYPVLEWYGLNGLTGQWEGPFYSVRTDRSMLVVVSFRRPVSQGVPPPAARAIHSIDKSRLALAHGNRIAEHNLFSLTRLDDIEGREYFPSTHLITRVRHLPRFGVVLALGNYNTSYSLRMCELGSNRQTEVISLTATSAMIEIAEDQRTALLVYSLSDGTVYRQLSRDGGWTWGTAQQCTVSSGGNLTAQALTDLDYSPRRRCWLLVVQTGSQTFKLYASDDGLVWQDTGL